LRKINGDRETDDIKKISLENWDVVVDFSGMYPDNVELITQILKGKAGRYIFVSSASAYVMDDEVKLKVPLKEDFETNPCTTEQRKDKDVLATYSQKKAESERILLSSDWLDVIIFRPALIYGRYDPTDRFYYWLYRTKFENEILIPEGGAAQTTSTYSKDFARVIEKAITIPKHNSVYNAITHDPLTIKDIVNNCTSELKNTPKLIDAPGNFLSENGVQPWADIPLWLGGPHLMLDNSRVKEDFGIEFESFEGSVRGCIDYYSKLGWKVPKYGLSIEREKELITFLKNRS
jgi:2'-hydroxyisoflavone reductase